MRGDPPRDIAGEEGMQARSDDYRCAAADPSLRLEPAREGAPAEAERGADEIAPLPEPLEVEDARRRRSARSRPPPAGLPCPISHT